MEGIDDAFMHFVDQSDQSGECLEVGPISDPKIREPPKVLNKEVEDLNGLLYLRGNPLREVMPYSTLLTLGRYSANTLRLNRVVCDMTSMRQ